MRILIVFLLLGFSSCATIVEAGPDRIPIRSEPDGAQVFLNGFPVGQTPMIVSVNRADDCHLEIKKDGFQSVSIDRDKVVAGWVFGNILIGGLIGLSVDLITHNQGKHSEDPIFTSLSTAKNAER